MKRTAPTIQITESPTLTLQIGSVIVDISNVNKKTPIYIRTSSGFLLKFDRIRNQCIPILYDYRIKKSTAKEKVNLLDGNSISKALVKELKDNLDDLFAHKMKADGTADFAYDITEPFEVKGLESGKHIFMNGVYIPSRKEGDHVYTLNMANTEHIPAFKDINPNDYTLIHIDKNGFEHQHEGIGSLQEGNKKCVAYFYSEKTHKLIIQIQDRYLTEKSIISVKESPVVKRFPNGMNHLLINGITGVYDDNGYPIEVNIYMDKTIADIEDIEEIIQQKIIKMAEGQLYSFENERKVLLSGLRYPSQTGKEYSIRGHISTKSNGYSFDIPEIDGKAVKQLTTLPANMNGLGYSYYMSETTDEKGERKIQIFALQTCNRLSSLKKLGSSAHIDEESLPKAIELCSSINIEKVVSTGDTLLIKTKEGVILSVILNGVDTQTRLVTISDTYLEHVGVSIKKPDEILDAARLATLYYGAPMENILTIIGKDKEKEENKGITTQFLVDIKKNVVIPTQQKSFERIVGNSHKDRIVPVDTKTPKKIHSRKSRDAEEEFVSGKIHRKEKVVLRQALSLSDYAPMGYIDDIGNKKMIAFGWNKATNTVMMSNTVDGRQGRLATYQLDKLEKNLQCIRVRFGSEHNQTRNPGLIMNDVSSILFEPSEHGNTIQLDYTQDELQYVE